MANFAIFRLVDGAGRLLFRGRPTGYCLVDEALHKTPYPLPLSGHVEFVDHAIVERLLTRHPIVAIRILTNLIHRLTRMVGEDLIEFVLQGKNLLSRDFNIRCLAMDTTQWLVN